MILPMALTSAQPSIIQFLLAQATHPVVALGFLHVDAAEEGVQLRSRQATRPQEHQLVDALRMCLCCTCVAHVACHAQHRPLSGML